MAIGVQEFLRAIKHIFQEALQDSCLYIEAASRDVSAQIVIVLDLDLVRRSVGR